MAKINNKVKERFSAGIKRYQKTIQDAQSRDINESDTVHIVRDILTDILGYDRYSEITTECAIRGTYCDIAIKTEGKIRFLIEVKAIGLSLKGTHLRQAIGYAANEGIEWIILTTGLVWQVYKVTFQKPIDYEMILSFNLLELNPKDERALESLYLLSKEGLSKSAIEDFTERQQTLNRFAIASLILDDVFISVLRREIKRVHKDVKVELPQLREIIRGEIIKRDILEDERFEKETKKFQRGARKAAKLRSENGGSDIQDDKPIISHENASATKPDEKVDAS